MHKKIKNIAYNLRQKQIIRRLLSISMAAVLVATTFEMPVYATEANQMVFKECAAGNTHVVSDSLSFEEALLNAADGDVIDVSNGATIMTSEGQENEPFVIDKAVTVTGGDLVVRKGGILLEADVTFQNMTLCLANNCHDAVWANGYTLTIDSVTCSSREADLFGGNLYLLSPGEDGTITSSLYTGSGSPGNAGKIVIKGSNGGFGNIYAGSMNGNFDKTVELQLETNLNSNGTTVYASGALEGRYDSDNWFDTSYQPDPPTASTSYAVTEQVTIGLTYNAGMVIHGATGGSVNAAVTYKDGGKGYPCQPVLHNVGSLSLKTETDTFPTLLLDEASTIAENTIWNLPVGGKLDLTDFAADKAFTIDSLNGGGTLILKDEQVLTITGSVTGSTNVAIGSVGYTGDTSTGTIYREHVYIKAPSSVKNETEQSFVLFPPNGEEVEFNRDENGDWWVPQGELFQITSINTALTDVVLNERLTSAQAVIAGLPEVLEVVMDEEYLADLYLSWSCENFDATPGAVNVFMWIVPESETDGWIDRESAVLNGTIKVTNPPALAVSITGENQTVTYEDAAIDVTQFFVIDINAGEATYEITEGTGTGILNGTELTVTKAGTFTVTVMTAPNGDYGSGTCSILLTVVTETEELPEITWPSAEAITYGQTLKESVLTDGSTEYGTFAWKEELWIPPAGEGAYAVVFTPSEDAQKQFPTLTMAEKNITLWVNKAKASVTPKTACYQKVYNDKPFSIAEDIEKIGEGAIVYALKDGKDTSGEPKAETEIAQISDEGVVTVLGSGSVTVILNMAETANYEAAEEQTVSIQVAAWDEVSRDGFFIKEPAPVTYTGKAIKPEPEVYDGNSEIRLTKGLDYTISYKNNVKAYTLKEGDAGFDAKKAPTMLIKGKGNYDKSLTVYFTILQKDISDLEDETITAEDMVADANGKVQKKRPVVKYHKKNLGKADFSCEYPDEQKEGMQESAYKEPGSYVVTVWGKGNYCGSRNVNLTIAAKGTNLAKATIKKIPTQIYDGENPVVLDKSKLVVSAKVDGKTVRLEEEVHYKAEYVNNDGIGTATVMIKAIDGSGFAGFKKTTFKIEGISIAKAKVEGVSNQVYSGSPKELELTVSLSQKDVQTGEFITTVLSKENDYEVEYTKNVNVGTASVKIKGKGKYSGTVKKTFKITKADITDLVTIQDGEIAAKYVKGGVKPVTELSYNGTFLTLGKDYTISYRNNKKVYTVKPGEEGYLAKTAPTMIITGKGNFTGSISRTFVILGRSLTDADPAVKIAVNDKAVSAKKGGYISKVVLTDADGKVLKQGVDYSAPVYSLVKESGETVTLTKNDIVPAENLILVSVTGLGAYDGEDDTPLTASYRITKKDFSKVKIAGIQKKYTGKKVILTPEDFQNSDGSSKVTFGSGVNKQNLVYGTDYKILPGSYKNNIKKGTASVTLIGLNAYGGTKKVTFRIGARSLWFWWL